MCRKRTRSAKWLGGTLVIAIIGASALGIAEGFVRPYDGGKALGSVWSAVYVGVQAACQGAKGPPYLVVASPSTHP